MAGTDKRKQSLYFPEEMLREIQEEATRQDRSLSWVVQQAWRIARERIKAFPAVNDVTGEPALPVREPVHFAIRYELYAPPLSFT